jgi:thiamine biosynthesis lipoprotein
MQETDTSLIAPDLFKKVVKLMGNRFEISVVSHDKNWAEERINEAIEEIRRIERLFTTYDDSSQVNHINKNAGIQPVKVDREVLDLIERSKKISGITQGAFDITFGSIDRRLWNFDHSMTSLPDAKTAKRLVRLINYRNVITNSANCTVFLTQKGMRLGFGGIGKGYAAEKAKQLLQQTGVESGIVNAAGDLTTWGYQPNGKPWTIGIAAPDALRTPFSYLDVTNTSIATSGNYEKYVVIDGKKYSHTIDPRTGMPVSGIKSVTIICPDAEIADAMATPVMIMGVRVGLDMVNQIKGIACIIIDDYDILHTSKNVQLT